MTDARQSWWRLLGRCLRLRCPVCGQGRLFRSGLSVNEQCPTCRFRFARANEYGSEGYFTGAMAINLVVTGVLPLIVIVGIAMTSTVPVVPLTTVGVIWTVVFPILGYRHACALWVFVDHLLNPVTAAELVRQDVAPASTPSPIAADRARQSGR
ncbi:MAG: DUF983 domain-containing protein [Chloroflexi bacterium]|nr:DUF983 domain-containing protein [Chloroflexota bacterium]